MYDKEPSDELVSRAFTEKIIDAAFRKEMRGQTAPTDERIAYFRRYTAALSEDEMANIFDMWNKDVANAGNIDSLLMPADMPSLARNDNEILEANKAFSDRQKLLASHAVKVAAA
jgi:hypothetical protein